MWLYIFLTLMDFPVHTNKNNENRIILHICLASQIQIQNNYVVQPLKIVFILANSADPDEMPPYSAFHLGLHFLPKYLCLDF